MFIQHLNLVVAQDRGVANPNKVVLFPRNEFEESRIRNTWSRPFQELIVGEWTEVAGHIAEETSDFNRSAIVNYEAQSWCFSSDQILHLAIGNFNVPSFRDFDGMAIGQQSEHHNYRKEETYAPPDDSLRITSSKTVKDASDASPNADPRHDLVGRVEQERRDVHLSIG